jgi:hypothetical protein
MQWEYQQLDVPTTGLRGIGLPDRWLAELNRLG